MKKTFALLNFASLLVVIYWNYYVNTQGINGNTVGSLSARYDNLFTPASYAFSIWGIIYLGLLVHCIFQMIQAFRNTSKGDFILDIGYWFLLTNIGNIAWLWAWLNEYTGFSVLVMIGMLISLLQMVLRSGGNIRPASSGLHFLERVPINIYFGWISVALIANIAAYLSKMQWPMLLSETTWTAIMLIVAVNLYLYLLQSRRLISYALVGVWALVAIALRQWELNPAIQWTAVIGAVVIVVLSIQKLFKRPVWQNA
ncbi:MAG: tryptophan-rich sensory protein [Bacteroidota bacterium]